MKTKPSSTASRITLIISILIIISGLGLLYYHQQTRYQNYVTATTPREIQSQLAASQQPLTILMDFKTGCQDCEKVHPHIIDQIKATARNHHVTFIMVDSKQPAIQTYLNQHGITNTPTVAVLRQGQVIQQYSGDNYHKLNRLLQGKDMDTNQPFPNHPYPEIHVVNDELNTNQFLNRSQHPDLNYLK